ncbi:hypothetical protein AAEX63_01590 [Luteococcus sp. H138]|uniref:hypothetical protein n=1 Tax=unclassified Luteococcus TaxID=2639923 RepID=UPI00313B724C
MTTLLLLLGVSFVSAFVPVVNLEAYLVGQSALAPGGVLASALVAALGQMLGKAIWYELGANIARIPWLAAKVQSPKWQVRHDELEAQLQGRPWFTAGTLLLSAAVGFPPFAIMSVLAGDLKVPRPVFWATGYAGRFIRFWATLGAADQLIAWLS